MEKDKLATGNKQENLPQGLNQRETFRWSQLID